MDPGCSENCLLGFFDLSLLKAGAEGSEVANHSGQDVLPDFLGKAWSQEVSKHIDAVGAARPKNGRTVVGRQAKSETKKKDETAQALADFDEKQAAFQETITEGIAEERRNASALVMLTKDIPAEAGQVLCSM